MVARPFPPALFLLGLRRISKLQAEQVALVNGTTIQADTTGGADAGSIMLNVGTLKTQAGPDGRVLISSTSNCAEGCLGGQAGDITIQGIPGVTPTVTRELRVGRHTKFGTHRSLHVSPRAEH